MNPFVTRSSAQRYATGRPNIHGEAVRRIRAMLSLEEPFVLALDVGCGTGLSTRALKEIANRVIGADLSPEMLACASPDERIHYLAASAEALPFPSAVFDLLLTSSAFHWFDRRRFLSEAERVLKPNGALAFFESGFTGRMEESPEFANWCRSSHLARYPSPLRHPKFGQVDGDLNGWRVLGEERYEEAVEMTLEQFVSYLLTQSNVIAAVEAGRESLEKAETWLIREIEPYFAEADASVRHFIFSDSVCCLLRFH
jgi:ubiquinone/menaquinone biosynthesis C-methylase UbiE